MGVKNQTIKAKGFLDYWIAVCITCNWKSQEWLLEEVAEHEGKIHEQNEMDSPISLPHFTHVEKVWK